MPVEKPDIQAIFNQAIALDSDEKRVRHLAQACGDDLQVRARVEALLRAHSEAGGFFGGKSPEADATEIHFVTEKPGAQIGPYKLLQQIGEGGFGIVFMAEQLEPVRRRVALKVIKPGMDTRQVIARFEAERQALSLMDHPNIAKVLDAGTTESGRPYFVMELVKGQPITQYCDEHHLTPRQRLELLLPVCQAIQHAHQKGIIHRDIKPTNILVAEYDQQPVPKVIDFGVAKATSQTLTEKTMFTGLGQIVGTLEYMSPEQAKVNQLDIDTRSDIYSLGVLLYELLTGSTPFDKHRLRSAAFDEMLRIIREEEPPKPSTRLSDSKDSLPSISANRKIEPARLTRLVRGELDWIVMKALEKDRNRRYETANGLAADIQHYLDDEPVAACPPSAGYRFRKFVQRNKGRLAVASILAAALLVAVSGIAWAVWDRESRENEIARKEADRQLRIRTQIDLILAEADRFIQQRQYSMALETARRADVLLTDSEADASTRGRVDKAIKDLAFVKSLSGIRLALLSTTKAGQFDDSVVVAAYSNAFREFGVDVESLPHELLLQRLRSCRGLSTPIADALINWEDAKAEIWRNQALGPLQVQAMRKREEQMFALIRELDQDPLRTQIRTLTAGIGANPVNQTALTTLAETLNVREQPPELVIEVYKRLNAIGRTEQAKSLLRRAQLSHPNDALINVMLGQFALEKKEYAEAIRFMTAAIACEPEQIPLWSNLGLALSKAGRPADAQACFRRILELDKNHVDAHLMIGTLLLEQGEVAGAQASYETAIALDRNAARAHFALGILLNRQSKHDDAIVSLNRSIALDVNHAPSHGELGIALMALGRSGEAIKSFRQVIAIDPKDVKGYEYLGHALAKQGDTESTSCFRKLVELDPHNVYGWKNLSQNLQKEGDWAGAIRAGKQAVELAPDDAVVLNNLAWLLVTVADPQLRDAKVGLELARRAVNLDPCWENLDTLAVAAFRCGQWQESLEARTKCAQARPPHVRDLYFMAMTNWHLEKKDEAKTLYAQATAEFEKDPTTYAWMDELKQEADRLFANPPPPLEKSKHGP